jgi:hypothetical protein
MAFHRIILQLDRSRPRNLVDAVALRTGAVTTSFCDLIVRDYDVARVGLNIEAIALFLVTVVGDLVPFKGIPVAAVFDSFLSEIHTGKTVPCDRIIGKYIVRIFVADGDPVAPVIFDYIV